MALSEAYETTLTVVTVNVDEEPELAVNFSVTGIPKTVLLKDGQPFKDLQGALGMDQLLYEISQMWA